jgi:hypothetical protein
MRTTETAGSAPERSGAVAPLIGKSLRRGDVDSTNRRSTQPTPPMPGIRTSTTATRTTTTRAPGCAAAPSADQDLRPYAEFSPVAVLFARRDSIYKQIPGCDVWDADRDALRWTGGMPVVAHPPCRAWGTLRHMAKPRDGEKDLALWAVDQIRKFGGVLEHPKRSTLWEAANLPAPRSFDAYGGWTLPILQFDFGHLAEKATLLYIVGCAPAELPSIPIALGAATHVVGTGGHRRDGARLRPGDDGWRPEISKSGREHTPPPARTLAVRAGAEMWS